MNRTEQLDAIISEFDLNTHPFYQDWRMGKLPVEKLRDYSVEYGRFVGTIAQGWDTLGETHYAEEERDHEKMWSNFQLGIGADAPTSTAVRAITRDCCAIPSALYSGSHSSLARW